MHELEKKVKLIKGKKTPESSMAFKASMAMLEAKTDNSSNESSFPHEKPKANNRNNPVLDKKGSRAMPMLDGQGSQKRTVSPVC